MGAYGEKELRAAFTIWDRRAAGHHRKREFDVVKVPHHGSIKSHSGLLCSAGTSVEGDRVAAVSAGNRPALPDREVLRAYLQKDWIMVATTTRTGDRSRHRLMDIADKSKAREYRIDRHDVRVRWSAKAGLTWEPDEARIDLNDLDSYDTNAR